MKKSFQPDRRTLVRVAVYLLGLVVLAFGITLNSRLGLGVSPIVSVAYCAAEESGMGFPDTTLIEYCVFALLELVIHAVMRKRGFGPYLMDLLQIPLSVVFTRFMDLFTLVLPNFAADFPGGVWGSLPVRLVLLLVAVACTGVGAAMSLDMRLIPNPGDGIVQALSDLTGREMGFTKNCFDLANVALAAALGFLLMGRLSGVGLGTVIAVLGVGRVVALFNRLFLQRLRTAAGLDKETK